MRIYLLRHGHAVNEKIDPSKPLSDQGIQEINAIADFLLSSQPNISTIFHSNKTRAQQTANIINDKLQLDCKMQEREDLSPNDNPEGMYQEIKDPNENIMVVGHLPFLARLLSWLLFAAEDQTVVHFETGTLVVLSYIPHSGWKISSVIQ